MRLILAKIGENKTIGYAFDELVRCLKRMDPSLFIDGRTYAEYDASLDGILWLGLNGSVAPSSDDEIRIDVKDGAGIVTGSIVSKSIRISHRQVSYVQGIATVLLSAQHLKIKHVFQI